MDRGQALLQAFLTSLRPWLVQVHRATGARHVTPELGEGGEFTVVVGWEHKGVSEAYRHSFTRQSVFGASHTLGPTGWAIERRACEHARDIMRTVLERRNVL